MHEATIAGSESTGHKISGRVAIGTSSRIEIIEVDYRQSLACVGASSFGLAINTLLEHPGRTEDISVEATDGVPAAKQASPRHGGPRSQRATNGGRASQPPSPREGH